MGLTAASRTGRRPLARLRRRRAKPFLINVGCGVLIPLVGRATTRTGPPPITQRDGMIDEATDMTAFRGRQKTVDVMDMGAMFLGSLVDHAS